MKILASIFGMFLCVGLTFAQQQEKKVVQGKPVKVTRVYKKSEKLEKVQKPVNTVKAVRRENIDLKKQQSPAEKK